MGISIYILFCSLLALSTGFFSRIPNTQMSIIFLPKRAKMCSKIQLIYNCAICFIMLICCVRGFFYDTRFQIMLIFILQLAVNAIYTFWISILSCKIKKKMLINSMKVFLEKDRSFSNNEELIKAFCKEYRDADFREAKRVLKKLEDEKMRNKVDG